MSNDSKKLLECLIAEYNKSGRTSFDPSAYSSQFGSFENVNILIDELLEKDFIIRKNNIIGSVVLNLELLNQED